MKFLLNKLGLRADDTRKLKILAPIFLAGGMADAMLYTAFMALFNTRLGVEYLPNIYMVEAFLIPLEAWLLAYLSSRWSKPTFVRWFYIVLIVIVFANSGVLGWIRFSGADMSWFYFVLFLSSNLVVRQLMLLMWSLAVDLLPTQQSKRLMPIFVTLTTVGGILAGLLAMAGGRWGGTELVYVSAAFMLVLGLPSLLKAVNRYLVPLTLRQHTKQEETDMSSRSQIARALRSPFILVTMGVMTFMPALYFVMEYEYFTVAETVYPDEGELTAFFGLMASVQFTVILVIQSFSSKLMQWLGAANTILAISICFVAAFLAAGLLVDSPLALVAVSSSFILVSLLSEYYAEPSFPMFFKMLPMSYRDGVRYLAQGTATSAGILLGSILLMLHSGQWIGLELLAYIGAGTALMLCLLAWFGRALYVKELIASIQVLHTQLDEFVASFLGGMRNHKAIQAVASLLDHSNRLVRELALQILARYKEPSLLPQLLSQLKDSSSKIRIGALRAMTLEGTGIQEMIQVAACLEDADPSVRTEGVRLLGRAGHMDHQAHYFIRMKLLDAHPMVAAEAVIALYQLRSEASVGACDEALDKMLQAGGESAVYACHAIAVCSLTRYVDRVMELLESTRASVRSAAVQCLGRLKAHKAASSLLLLVPRADKELLKVTMQALLDMGEEALPTLRRSVDDPHSAIWRTAIYACASVIPDEEVKDSLVKSCLMRVERMHEEKNSVDALILAGEHELAYIAHQRYEEIRSNVLEGCWYVMERLTDQQVVQTVRAAVEDTDQEVRDNGLEVLSEGLGDRHLAGTLLEVYQAWEEWQMAELSDPAAVIQETAAGSGDHWLREIAGEAVRKGGEGSMESSTGEQMLSLLDKVVFLKQVTMFSELSLEELGLIAGHAEEIVFPEDAYILNQGEVNPTLYVIIEGNVEISSVSSNGWEGTIGVLGPKQYFGDTTVLSPISSMVSAQALFTEVKVLALNGDDLTRLIRLYPEIGIGLLQASNTRVRLLEDMVLKLG